MADTTLTRQCSDYYNSLATTIPANVFDTIKTTVKEFSASFDYSRAVKAGDRFPDFSLKDAFGKTVTLAQLLAKGGPLLVCFYRGDWCTYCNLELRALQKTLPQLTAKGGTLVAISPELPDQAIVTSKKNELTYPVLSDEGNVLAKQLGLFFQQPERMREVMVLTGAGNWKERYGDHDDTCLGVPVAATILVDKAGVVRNTFIDPDWSKRLEPSTALQWIDEL